jgi:hypothetical protein
MPWGQPVQQRNKQLEGDVYEHPSGMGAKMQPGAPHSLHQQQQQVMDHQQAAAAAAFGGAGGYGMPGTPSNFVWPGMMSMQQQGDGYPAPGSSGSASNFQMTAGAGGQFGMDPERSMGMPMTSAGIGMNSVYMGMDADSIMAAQQQNFMMQQLYHNQMQSYGGAAAANMPFAAAAYYAMPQQQQSSMQSGQSVSAALLNSGVDRKVTRQKKNKFRPKRPLSAYNLFFKEERAKLLAEIPDNNDGKEETSENERKDEDDSSDKGGEAKKPVGRKRKRQPHGKVSFETMAKLIGARWKEIDEERLVGFKEKASEDMKRYKKEMDVYLTRQRQGLEHSREQLESSVDQETKLRYFASGGSGSVPKSED